MQKVYRVIEDDILAYSYDSVLAVIMDLYDLIEGFHSTTTFVSDHASFVGSAKADLSFSIFCSYMDPTFCPKSNKDFYIYMFPRDEVVWGSANLSMIIKCSSDAAIIKGKIPVLVRYLRARGKHGEITLG